MRFHEVIEWFRSTYASTEPIAFASFGGGMFILATALSNTAETVDARIVAIAAGLAILGAFEIRFSRHEATERIDKKQLVDTARQSFSDEVQDALSEFKRAANLLDGAAASKDSLRAEVQGFRADVTALRAEMAKGLNDVAAELEKVKQKIGR